MEVSNELLIVSSVVVCLVSFVIWYLTKKPSLPGPRGLPIIGHLHLIGKEPEKSLYELSKKHGNFMFINLGSVQTVVASTRDLALEFLKVHDKVCSSRPEYSTARIVNPDSMIWSPYGPRFRSMRKVTVTEMLTPKRVMAAQRIRAEELAHMLKAILNEIQENPGKSMMIGTKFAVLNMNVITGMSMRKKFFGTHASSEEAEKFKNMVTEFFAVVVFAVNNIGDYVPFLKPFDLQGYIKRMKKVASEFDHFLDNIVEDHKKNKTTDEDKMDFLDVLLQAAQDNPEHFGRGTAKALVQDLIAAGTESTATTVQWCMIELLSNPDKLQKALEELDSVVGRDRRVTDEDIPNLKYIPAIVNEALRMHPPGPLLLPHEAQEDFDVNGYHIKKGTRVICNLYAIFRDPGAWSNPGVFEPERFLEKGEDWNGVTPFGAGRRMCPGIPLGLSNANITLATVLQCFNWEAKKSAKGTVDYPLEVVATPRLAPEVIMS